MFLPGPLLALILLAPPSASAAPVQNPSPAGEPLEFREFFVPKARALEPSARLLTLNGHRVRLVGFMALMESPPKGGFYLCARPVLATEAGAGTADLPPEAVRVIVRSAQGKEVAHVARALEVNGILEIGSAVDEEGQVSTIRLVLDAPAPPTL